MFLKINWKNRVKKLNFSNEVQTFDGFLKVIKEITRMEIPLLKIHFIDMENEKLEINDPLDFEYFVNALPESKYKEVFVDNVLQESEIFFVDTQPENMDHFMKKLENDMENLSCGVSSLSSHKLVMNPNFNSSTRINGPTKKIKPFYQGIEEIVNAQPESAKCSIPSTPINLSSYECLQIPKPEIKFLELKLVEEVSKPQTPFLNLQPIQVESQEINFPRRLSRKTNTLAKCRGFKGCSYDHDLENPSPIVTIEEQVKPVKTVHNHVTCDVCMKRGIEGKRYKCLLCVNFDICEECEAKNLHNQHPMVRICAEESEKVLAKLNKKYSKHRRMADKKKKIQKKLEQLNEKLRPENIKKFVTGVIEPTIRRAVNSFEMKSSQVQTETTCTNEFGNMIQEFERESDKIEKIELLRFIFGDAQAEVIDELVSRFANLNLAEMCQEIEKNNRIIDQM